MKDSKIVAKIVICLMITVLSGVVFVNDGSAAEIKVKPSVAKAGKLLMGSTLSYAPFEFRDENNNPTGIDVELAQRAAELMNVKLEIVEIPFVNSLPALASGRTDIAWASYTIREDRLKQVDFVVFMTAGSVLSATPEKAAEMQSKNDMCGKKIAILVGGSADFTLGKLSDECVAAGLKPIEKQVYPDVASFIQAVLNGRVDGRLDDSTASGYFEKTSGGKLVVVPNLYEPTPGGVAVPKGDKEAAEMMQSVLQAMIEDGSYKAIFEKYGMGASTIDEAYIVTSIDELRQ
jgi:polar amino acid transport system substrate-binding protein